MPSQIIGVVGAGTMGGGIAEAAVTHGLEVILYDVGQEILARARERIRASLHRQVQRRRLSAQEAEAAIARLRLTTRLEDLGVAALLIEAAPEDIALKRDLFAALDRIAPPGAILASNTSSLSITALAGATQHPERVVGMHFFNPAPVMPLVEVIAGRSTAAEVVAAAVRTAQALGKTPVRARDTPGFIVNRIARPYYGEALRLLAEGIAPAGEIDRIMRLAGGFRMGPFELLDLIGLDVNLAVTRSVYEAFFHEPRFRPHPLQEAMVRAGLLGRKSGRGFYVYDQGEPGAAPEPTTQMNGSVATPGSPSYAGAGRAATRQLRSPGHVIIVGAGVLAEDLVQAGRAAGWAIEHAAGPDGVRPNVGIVVDLLLEVPAKARLIAALGGAEARTITLTLALPASTTAIASASGRPETIVGFATLLPWSERKLVEVIPGLRSAPEAVDAAEAFFHGLGKETAIVRDAAGGVFPRIFAMIVNEAAFALADGVASAEDIDTALRLGANYPRGPLALADQIGLDVLLAVLEGLQRESGEDRHRPAPLLRTLVAAGWTGRAAGRGFHEGSDTTLDA